MLYRLRGQPMRRFAVDRGCAPLFAAAIVFLAAVGFAARTEGVNAQDQATVKQYGERRWSFDIQDGRIRFSHGNHARRDRWFRAYFGKAYRDCTTCHAIELARPADALKVDLVTEIRRHADAPTPYGVREATCLTCHNNVTAPNDCAWCHVPGSRALAGVAAPALGQYEEAADSRIPDYNERFELGVHTVQAYKEKKWFFDIQNDNIRFSHGNHKSRDRLFNAYFGSTYQDCGNCHNLGLLTVGPDGPVVEDGEHLNTVETIREYETDIYPFGIMMARCFSACHNNLTAPNDCTNCHLPGSRALTGGALADDVAAVATRAGRATAAGAAHPGERIYLERRCDLCHKVDGVGAPVASDLSDVGNRRDAKWLAQFLANHQEAESRPATPRLNLSAAEGSSLAQYLTTLRR